MKNPPIHSILQQGFCLIFFLALLSSCVREGEYANDSQGDFEQLWKVINRQYCFLNYKQIDWDDICAQYQGRITPNMSNEGLFKVLNKILYELQGGHVNLTSTHNVSYYDAWYQDCPRNFRADLIEDSCLSRASTDYHTAAGLKYKILKGNIGYIRYGSFADPIGNGNLDEVLSYLAICSGLIIDVCDNGGGDATNPARIASRFTDEKVLTRYICHKTGTGHNDFFKPYVIYLKPTNGVRWRERAVVLASRHSFSATNDFVGHVRCLPSVTIIGDRTGGGSGMPSTSELPNGWGARFSANPRFDTQMKRIESGIEPDVKVDMLQEDKMRGKGTLIETTRRFLSE